MWTYNNELYHYGVKGMRWGIRKNDKRYKNSVARRTDSIIMISKKGFKIESVKFDGFLLKPGEKHSSSFFELGYSPNDKKRLFKDIEKGYEPSKIVDRKDNRYSIFMKLGITETKTFRTVWEKPTPHSLPKLVSAYRRDHDV